MSGVELDQDRDLAVLRPAAIWRGASVPPSIRDNRRKRATKRAGRPEPAGHDVRLPQGAEALVGAAPDEFARLDTPVLAEEATHPYTVRARQERVRSEDGDVGVGHAGHEVRHAVG